MNPNKLKRIFVVATLLLASLTANNSASGQTTDIYAGEFTDRVDSLITVGNTAEAYTLLYQAGQRAEAEKEIRQSVKFYTKALTIMEKEGQAANQINCLLRLSNLNHAREYYGTGLKQLEQAHNLAKSNRLTQQLIAVTDAQWRFNEKIGNMTDAFKYYRQNSELKLANSTDEYQRQLNKLKDQGEWVEAPQSTKEQHKADNNGSQQSSLSFELVGVVVLLLMVSAILLVVLIRTRKKARAELEVLKSAIESIPGLIESSADQIHQKAAKILDTKQRDRDKLFDQIIALAADCDSLALHAANINSLAKSESPQTETINIDMVVKQAVEKMSVKAEAAGVKTDYKSTGKTELEGDREAILQTLCNMLSNAIDFSQRGDTVKLWIETDEKNVSVGVEGKNKFDDQQSNSNALGFVYNHIEGATIGMEVCRESASINGGKLVVECNEDGNTTLELRFKNN